MLVRVLIERRSARPPPTIFMSWVRGVGVAVLPALRSHRPFRWALWHSFKLGFAIIIRDVSHPPRIHE